MKKKGAGRPPLPEGQAKDRVVGVRFTAAEVDQIAAEIGKGTISDWIRGLVYNALTKRKVRR